MKHAGPRLLRAAVLSILVLVAAARSATAQLTPPGQRLGPGSGNFPASVSVKVEPHSVKPGEVVTIEVTVTLDPGYHTYDLEQPDVPEVASQITLDPSESLVPVDSWIGTPAEEKFDEILKKRIFLHYMSPTWTQQLKVSADASPGEHKISGRIRITVCDEKGCLPPRTEKFSVAITVDAAGGPSAAQVSTAGPPVEMPAASDEAAVKNQATPTSDEKTSVVRKNRQVGGLLGGLGFGFLAGLILNVMPCVLPVISLKIYGFVKQAGEDRRRIRLLGLTFGAGILFVFLILAGLAATLGYGWGRLFQRDDFVIGMIALMVAFTLGMFDVYVIQLPGMVSDADAATAQKEGLVASFGKGMLATLISTPCSGPFLGATVSYALTQPPLVIFGIYAAMGLGMASPYVVLSWYPGWMRGLPRPGEWMNWFKQFVGFLLLATAVWLLWQRRSDGELVVWTVAFCVAVSLAMWLYGRLSDPLLSIHWHRLAPVLAILLIGLSAYFCFGVMYEPPAAVASTDDEEPVLGKWNKFKLDKVVAMRAQGKTVVVDWTADW